jgi:hypothetical protein
MAKTTTKASKAAQSRAAVLLGRKGGAAGTPKQNAARAVNAKRAGRPRRVCNCCGEPVRGGHVDIKQDSRCKAPGWHWETPNEKRAAAGVQ